MPAADQAFLEECRRINRALEAAAKLLDPLDRRKADDIRFMKIIVDPPDREEALRLLEARRARRHD